MLSMAAAHVRSCSPVRYHVILFAMQSHFRHTVDFDADPDTYTYQIQRAASLGYPRAQAVLGWLHIWPIGDAVRFDMAAARDHLISAMRAGEPVAFAFARYFTDVSPEFQIDFPADVRALPGWDLPPDTEQCLLRESDTDPWAAHAFALVCWRAGGHGAAAPIWRRWAYKGFVVAHDFLLQFHTRTADWQTVPQPPSPEEKQRTMQQQHSLGLLLVADAMAVESARSLSFATLFGPPPSAPYRHIYQLLHDRGHPLGSCALANAIESQDREAAIKLCEPWAAQHITKAVLVLAHMLHRRSDVIHFRADPSEKEIAAADADRAEAVRLYREVAALPKHVAGHEPAVVMLNLLHG